MDFKTKIKSTVTTGTAPFDITSTTLVTNLNVDLLDGKHADAFATAVHTQAWSTITSTPTTVAGYGIIDAVYGTDGVATESLTEPYSRIVQAAVAPSGTVASTPFPDLWLDTTSTPFKLKFWDGQVWQATDTGSSIIQAAVAPSGTIANTPFSDLWLDTTSVPFQLKFWNGQIWQVIDGGATEPSTEPHSCIIQAAVAPSGTVASTPFPDLWLDTASVPFKLKFWDGQIWQAINTWQ